MLVDVGAGGNPEMAQLAQSVRRDPSFVSLLGLLRSASSGANLSELAAAGGGGGGSGSGMKAPGSLVDLQSLAAIARVASQGALDNNGGGGAGAAAAGGRGGGAGSGMKESDSVSSLVELVRSSSASSLVNLMHSYSAGNLVGLVADAAVPPADGGA